MRPDDPQNRRQTQTPARRLGREEGIEYVRLRLLVHAAAIVVDFEEHIAARHQRAQAQRVLRVGVAHILHPGADAHRSATLADRFGAIGNQIQRHLPDLGRVGFNLRNISVQIHPEMHFLGNRRLRQTRQVLDQFR